MSSDLAIVGGSGVDTFAGWEATGSHDLTTAYGAPSASIEAYRCCGSDFYYLARHGRPHRIAPHRINYRANLRALYELGARRIVAINAVGGIAANVPAGAVMIPDQIIDYTYGREHTYGDGDAGDNAVAGIAVQHIDFTEPYSPGLRADLLAAAAAAGAGVVDGGVYAAMQGPRLESAAEILRLERDGCAVVGMTGMPEAALARELGIAYASLCIVVNAAAGKGTAPLTVDAMQAPMTAALAEIEKILAVFLRAGSV